jgi:hypothetical protein
LAALATNAEFQLSVLCTASASSLDRSTNHLTKMIPDPRLINLDHLSIGFSSLIGCSFILEEAVNPERSRWRASVTGKQTGEFIARPRQWQAGLAVPDRVRH